MKRAAAVVWTTNVILVLVVAGLWRKQLQHPGETPASGGVPYSVQQICEQLRTAKMYHGNPTRLWIALTFDDGPHPYHTPVLLKTLRRLKVRATFFVVGKNVDGYPYVTVLWTIDPADYERPDVKTLRQRLFLNVRPGSIILLHEKVPQTMEVLPEFVREMRRRGYEFVTVEEMWKDMQRSVMQMASYERGGLPSPFFGGS
jgi:hypothetical protein